MRTLIHALILTVLATTAVADDNALSQALLNGKYTLGARDYTLTNGRYNRPGDKAAVTVLETWLRTGDLNGDGRTDVAAPVSISSGMSEFTHYVIAALDNGQGGFDRAAGYLGDRMELQAVEVDQGRLTVDLKHHARTDHLCCPTLEAKRAFVLEQGTLACHSSTSLTLDPAAVHVTEANPYGALTRSIEVGKPWLESPQPQQLICYPDQVRLALGGGTPGVLDPREPQVRVTPIAAYQEVLDAEETKLFEEQLGQIKSLIKAKAIKSGKNLPLLPAVKEARKAQAHAQLVEFKGGSGLRYVTALPAKQGSAAAAGYLYVFEGLSQDGRYLVSAYLPLQLSTETASAAPAAGPETALEQLALDALNPKPADLDQWLSTLEIAAP